MEKVDRLDWRSGLSFTAYGVSVGVRTNDSRVLERALASLPPGAELQRHSLVDNLFSIWVGKPSQRRGRRNFHLLYMGAAILVRTLDLDELFRTLENYVTLLVAYFASTEVVFVHAGVVGWRGNAIVIPGRSQTGKSTLVEAFVSAGATYYSDEMAIFDRDGRVHAFPVPLALRGDDGQRRHVSNAIGHTRNLEPLPVGTLLVTEYVKDANWRPRPLSPGRAVMALLDNTVAARRSPAEYLPILRQVASGSVRFASKRGEAAEAVHGMISELNERTKT